MSIDTAAGGIRIVKGGTGPWGSDGNWEMVPCEWAKMGLSTDELAALFVLLCASHGAPTEPETLQTRAGLGRNRWRAAVRGLEGRGLVIRTRTTVRGNAKTYELHRQPVPAEQRTGEAPTVIKRKRAETYRTARPVVDSAGESVDNPTYEGSTTARPVVHNEQENSRSEDRQGSTTGRAVLQGSTTGREVAPPIQRFKTSSSFGSSSNGEHVAGSEEEEEAQAKEEPQTGEHDFTARRLLAAAARYFKPGKYLRDPHRGVVLSQIAALLVDGYPASQLGRELIQWAADAVNPAVHLPAMLTGAAEKFSHRPRRVSLPPVCGQCDARPDDPVGARQVLGEDGRTGRCPRCHPDAIESGRRRARGRVEPSEIEQPTVDPAALADSLNNVLPHLTRSLA